MKDLIKKFDQQFAASFGVAELTADEWFMIRDELVNLKKQIEILKWQLREQD